MTHRFRLRLLRRCVAVAALGALAAAPALPQIPAPAGADNPAAGIGSSASITLGSGPHKGKYDFAPSQACVLAAFGDKPLGLSVVMNAHDSSLSIDIPNLDAKHASEIQVVLVVADVKEAAARTSTASTTYEIDTRPDASLEPFQRAERANRGITGKATTTLMTQGHQTLISFTGETAKGVKISGDLTCWVG